MTRQAVIAVLVLDGEHRCVHGHLRADRCRLPLTSDVVDAGADNCTGPVELHLPLELEGKLAAAASRRNVSVEVLAREAQIGVAGSRGQAGNGAQSEAQSASERAHEQSSLSSRVRVPAKGSVSRRNAAH